MQNFINYEQYTNFTQRCVVNYEKICGRYISPRKAGPYLFLKDTMVFDSNHNMNPQLRVYFLTFKLMRFEHRRRMITKCLNQ